MTFERDRLPDPVSYYEGRGLSVPTRGKWFSTRCEFHDGSDSMRVNRESGAYVCMAGCGAKGGDVLAYEMAATGAEFIDAAKALGAWVEDPNRPQTTRRKPLPFSARDALEVLADEATLVAVAAGNVSQGLALSDEDRSRVMSAAGRIRVITEACA